MAAKKDEIRAWLEEGKKNGAAFVLVACDTFDWEDYPVPCKNVVELKAKAEEIHNKNMQKVMECYDLSLELEPQLLEFRAWHGWRPS